MLAVIWVVPVAWIVGRALRSRAVLSVLWGISISLLLTAVFVWFGREPFSRICAVIAAVVLVCALVYLLVRRANRRVLLFANVVVLVLLFVPRLIVVAAVQKLPPPAHKVWSVVLQKGTWQGMNTGSEFGATRQLTFAGDRIVAVFDAGYPRYQRKEPMSNYHVLSPDRNTGGIKNQMEFAGKWGAMPYIYGTHDGKVALVGEGPIKLLNPDLSSTGKELRYDGIIHTESPDGTTLGWETLPGLTMLDADSLQPIGKISQNNPVSISRGAVLNTDHYWYRDYPKDQGFLTLTDDTGEHLLFHSKCGISAQFLTSDRVLINGCGKVYILDAQGKAVQEGSITPVGEIAGVSQNGNRFALEDSDERGDPPVLLYEQFVIYDATTLKPLAGVSVGDLPERQSWSAFSPDGHFFAVGNPDKLTLYQVP